MSKYRLLQRGDVLPASFVSALQEYVGSDAINLVLTLSNATTVQIPAGAGSTQAAVGIEGLWRYRSSSVTAAVSGSAGVKDVYVTAADNSFSNTPQPDTDNTNYDFGLVVVPLGSTPTLNPGTVDVFRKVGEVDWDGSKVIAIRQMAGLASALSPVAPTAPTRDVTPLPVHGTADQVAPLATFSAGASVVASVGSDGVYDGQGVAVAGTPLASTHLSDTAALARLASPTFTGNPRAPTPAADDNDTSIVTTAWVMGQLSAVGDGTPPMDGVAARGTSVHLARADHVHPSDTSRAPLASPTFTGTPAAPTAAVDTNTTQVATTAFVLAQAAGVAPAMDGAAAVGTSTRYARADHVHPTDTSRAPLASPTLTGTPAAPTAAVDTNTTQIATTAFVIGQGYLKGSVAAGTYAPLASPTFTGIPAAPTAAVDTNTTQVATTAFVLAQASATAPAMDGAAAVGTSTRYARADHVHPSDTSRAPLASPTFTGTPSAPTPAAGGAHANDTTLATTAFVTAALAGFTSGPSPSAATPAMDSGAGAVGTAATYARGDHVHPTDTSRAPLASPTFTGTVTSPNVTISGSGKTMLSLADTGAQNSGLTIGGDTNLYRSAASTLRTDGDFYHQGNVVVATNNVSRLYFGSALDTNLYRSAAGTLAMNGVFTATSAVFGGHNLYDASAALVTDGNFRAGGYLEAMGDSWVHGHFRLAAAGYSTLDLYNWTGHIRGGAAIMADGYLQSGSHIYLHGTQLFFGSSEDAYIERQTANLLRTSGGFAVGGASVPIAGTHIEMSHNGSVGVIESYGRSSGLHYPLNLYGSSITLTTIPGGERLIVDSGGFAFLGREASYGTGNIAYGVSTSGGGVTQLGYDSSGGFQDASNVIEVVRSLLRSLHKKGIITITDFPP